MSQFADIISTIENWLNSPEGQAELNNYEDLVTPEEAALLFIEILQSCIASSGLSSKAFNAVYDDWCCDSIVNTSGNEFTIEISHHNGGRDSLYKDGYPEGITDIAELLNNGVDHVMKPVYGLWDGEYISSKTVIGGAHFIEDAKRQFTQVFQSRYQISPIVTNE